jgi:hypothetical protein
MEEIEYSKMTNLVPVGKKMSMERRISKSNTNDSSDKSKEGTPRDKGVNKHPTMIIHVQDL